MQFGFIVLTTSAGIMDHEEARRKNVGGKVLGFFYWIWFWASIMEFWHSFQIVLHFLSVKKDPYPVLMIRFCVASFSFLKLIPRKFLLFSWRRFGSFNYNGRELVLSNLLLPTVPTLFSVTWVFKFNNSYLRETRSQPF